MCDQGWWAHTILAALIMADPQNWFYDFAYSYNNPEKINKYHSEAMSTLTSNN